MRRKPSFGSPRLNARLDSYRHRAAEIRNEAGFLGVAYVEPMLMAEGSGHLWWRRWAPAQEHLLFWVDYPGHECSDHWVMSDAVDTEIGLWALGQSFYIPGDARLIWLDDAARTRQIRRGFGIREAPARD